MVIDKFSILVSFNYRNFVAGYKHFIHSGMPSLDTMMALKNHYGFKYVHDSRFPRQSNFQGLCIQDMDGFWWKQCQ
jgi:hypothetical protein